MQFKLNLSLYTFILVIFSFLFYFGHIQKLILMDFTFITPLIMIVYIITTTMVLVQTYRKQPSKDYQWFISDVFMSLGLLGTIFGLIVVFATFGTIDLSNIASSKEMVLGMSGGIAVALYTTLIGLIASILLKIKLVICDS